MSSQAHLQIQRGQFPTNSHLLRNRTLKKKTTTVKTHHAGGILASSRLSIRTIDDDAIVTKMIWHSDPEKPNKMRIEGQLEQTTIDE